MPTVTERYISSQIRLTGVPNAIMDLERTTRMGFGA